MAAKILLSEDGEEVPQQRICIYGNAGEGKAQPLDEPVLTLNGFVPISSIEKGDYVITKSGHPTRVLDTILHDTLNMYELTFSDGTSVRCCEDHLWTVQTRSLRTKNKYVTLPLKEMLENISKPISGRLGCYYKIPIGDPVLFAEKELTVEPYLLGYLLGNGSSRSGCLQLTTGKPDTTEILNNVSKFITRTYYKSPTADQSYIDYSVRKHYEALGLGDTRSRDKFIPKDYLLASVDQRIALLQGLMDSDGSCSDNKARFHSCSKRLAEDCVSLIRSLGGLASLSVKDRTFENKPVEYTIYVRVPFNPFRLERKAKHYVLRWNDFDNVKGIIKAEYLGKMPGKCITVSNSSQLYITKDYTVTHNSTAAFSVIQLEDYNVVVYCPEATSLIALQNAMAIYGIEKLEEGKLTLVIPDKGSFKSKELMMSAADETTYNKLHEVFFQGKGVDAATGKSVVLKKVWEYPEDTIIIYDGWSAIMESIGFKAQAEWNKENGKDKRNMYQIGQGYVANFFNIMNTVRGHFILTAHSMVADDVAQGKFKGLKTINPNFYTKSLCVPICGKFTTVFYAKRDSLSNRFTLSLAETSAFTRDSVNRTTFKEVADELNKSLKQNEKITLSSLPTDLTSEVYNFFNNNLED